MLYHHYYLYADGQKNLDSQKASHPVSGSPENRHEESIYNNFYDKLKGTFISTLLHFPLLATYFPF